MRSLLLLLALAASAHAGEAPSVPVKTYTLDNGLTVLLSHDDRLPVVAVEVRYLVGSAHEVKGRSGFAHLFEHLMFQGSKSFDDEYFKPFEPIGAAVNGTTNTDRTNYYERVPANYLELALWMESDRMSGLLTR
ncbi:MAG: insulinase family protein [bacterium]